MDTYLTYEYTCDIILSFSLNHLFFCYTDESNGIRNLHLQKLAHSPNYLPASVRLGVDIIVFDRIYLPKYCALTT